MNAREQLIEKAAKAIDPPAWTGGIAHDPRWADEAEARRISAMRQARAALSVFEEAHAVGSSVPVVSDVQDTAHAPSDDEQEALARWLHMRFALPGSQSSDWEKLPEHLKTGWRDLAGDAPSRRTVQGEPSDATLGVMAQRFYEASGLNIPHTSKPEVVRGLRAALRAAAEAEGWNR